MDKATSARIFENIMDVASDESKALEAHENWFRHIKDCPQCSNGPFCERGKELDAIAEKWAQRWERSVEPEASHMSADGIALAALTEIRDYVAEITPGTDWGDEVVRMADNAIARAKAAQ